MLLYCILAQSKLIGTVDSLARYSIGNKPDYYDGPADA